MLKSFEEILEIVKQEQILEEEYKKQLEQHYRNLKKMLEEAEEENPNPGKAQQIKKLVQKGLVNLQENNIIPAPMFKADLIDKLPEKISLMDLVNKTLQYAKENNLDANILREQYQLIAQELNIQAEMKQKLFLQKSLQRENNIHAGFRFASNNLDVFGDAARNTNDPFIKLIFAILSLFYQVFIMQLTLAALVAHKAWEARQNQKYIKIQERVNELHKQLASVQKTLAMHAEQQKAKEFLKQNPDILKQLIEQHPDNKELLQLQEEIKRQQKEEVKEEANPNIEKKEESNLNNNNSETETKEENNIETTTSTSTNTEEKEKEQERPNWSENPAEVETSSLFPEPEPDPQPEPAIDFGFSL